jgi:glutaredoxin
MEAREAYRKKRVPFEYLDVLKDGEAMVRMLQFSKGQRLVPVIVDQGNAQIGFGGGS